MSKWIVTLLILFALSSVFPASAAARQVYVALGDSLAAGQTPYREIDQGYTDLVAGELARSGQLALFSKELAFPGFTAEQVLNSIETEEAQNLVSQASLITVSAGANDLLRIVNANPEQGTLAFQQVQVDFALNQARISVETLLKKLEELAPQANVLVVGYYFAYPHVADFQKEGTSKQLDRLNQILEQSARKYGATYVDVTERMNTDLKAFVPNPADVHPVQEGYRQMANSVLQELNPGYIIEPYEMPAPNPMSFEEIQAAQEEQQQSESDDQVSLPGQPNLALAQPIPYI
ncbi:hypothetical protein CF394_14995 [Tetzosporium hominis]|uniref:SGNH hydrolase-type esterase domain-containing protein n=1 Tax=Tetzosporium hominis TaxID=2020506 RepID=A0A264VZL8_9BACL|nr:SGNH/GDSL hydrolase family protein [Tetzosporium hominis]OZS76779.1 hypothetical protein CF394_14995 [Tetzosporium hominis]